MFNSTFGVPKVEKFEIRISKSETTAPTEHLSMANFKSSCKQDLC